MLEKTQEEIIRNWGDCDFTQPLVSIKCITYNQEAYIGMALDSFLMQETDFPFEVIVHDDASTDNTAKIISEYEKAYPLIIKPIYESENLYSKDQKKMSDIINAQLQGKYIALCEGDDFWCDKRKLQKQANALEQHPECSVALCRVQFIEKDGNKLKKTAPMKGTLEKNIVTLEDYAREEYGQGQWTFHTSSYFYRACYQKAFYEARRKEYKNFPYGDMPLIIYLLSQGNGFFLPDTMSCYRTFSGGYNSFIKANPQVAVNHSQRLVQALLDLDQMTGEKYHSYIMKKIARENLMQFGKQNRKSKYFFELIKFKNIKNAGVRYVCYEFLTNLTPGLYKFYTRLRYGNKI